MPHGLRDTLRRPAQADFFVDVEPVRPRKRALLDCHRSQQEWLDSTQDMGAYLETMVEMTRAMGARSGRYAYAEGWRRHSHLGFAAEEHDPLGVLLSAHLSPAPTL